MVRDGSEGFYRALSDFSFDVASGGAIRHLTDLGYTVKQIQERLDYPTPFVRIQEAVWKRLVETGVILLEEPRGQKPRERVNFVREYDSYGRASFRRVAEPDSRREAAGVYLACGFGVLCRGDREKYERVLAALDGRQAEYIAGLPWPGRRVWHRADGRMLEIERRLEAVGLDRGVCRKEERGN